MRAQNVPYIIRLSSQKGGVGKTTIAVNLSTALSTNGYKVLLIDSDISNPSVMYYLGIKKPNVGFEDVLLKRTRLEEAKILYKPTGMYILPEIQTDEMAIIRPGYFDTLNRNIETFGRQLHKGDFDFVIFDSAPGIISEKLLRYYDEALLVTTPEMPAIGSVVKLGRFFDENKVKHNLIINRFNHDIDIDDVKEFYGKAPIAVLPEDPIVRKSLAKEMPAYLADKKAPFSKGIDDLVKYYSNSSIKTKSK